MTPTNGLITLAELFTDRIISVPAFQRAYAWDDVPHLQDYIEDLKSQPAGTDKQYFFGTILLTARGGNVTDRMEEVEVVDGQQRLTTTCIFVKAALDRLDGIADAQTVTDFSERFISKSGNRRRFRTIDQDDGFFERFILGAQQASQDDCKTPSQHRLRRAKEYFRQGLAGLSPDRIVALLNVLWDTTVLLYTVRTNAEATQIFELQNDRGKRLTDLEALKSFLMHALYLQGAPDTESDLRIVQNNFAAIYRGAEEIESQYDPPDEDQLLSYHCIAFEQWLTLDQAGTYGWRRPKQLIKRILGDRNLRGGLEVPAWVKAFSGRLEGSFGFALQICRARDTCEPLGNLTALQRSAPFWPLLLTTWKHDAGPKKAAFATVVRGMERFAFRALIAGKRADTGDGEFRTLARDFAGDFVAAQKRLATLCEGWEIPRLFAQRLDSEDFYGAFGSTGTYLLWRYENYLRTLKGQQYPALPWRTVADAASQAVAYAKDHIEPKDEKNPVLMQSAKWNSADTGEPLRTFREVFLNRLGNLVLDTLSAGAAKGSSRFPDRIEHYRSSGLLSQSELMSYATKAGDGTLDWDGDAIRKRQKRLIDFAIGNL